MTTYSSILIMTTVNKHDISRNTNMTSVDRQTNNLFLYIYTIVVVSQCPGRHLYSQCPGRHLHSQYPGRHLCPSVPACNFSLSVPVVIYIPCVPVVICVPVCNLYIPMCPRRLRYSCVSVSRSSFIFPVSRSSFVSQCPSL